MSNVNAGFAVRDRHWGYAEWVDLLGGHFFRAEGSGQPVTLFVDDDELGRLSELPPEEAADSLAAATSEVLGNLGTTAAYANMRAITRAWEKDGSAGYLRCLPLLALAVLAATRMASDGVIHSHNYYRRYRDLVGLEGIGQPDGYELMPDMWLAYQRWLNETRRGDLGLSTVVGHPRFTYIGYAMSQALFRASDRYELTHFLAALPGPVTPETPNDLLLAALRHWAASRSSLSRGAAEMIEQDRFSAQVLDIVRSSASIWDGVIRDDSGRRQSRVLLRWNLEEGDPLTCVADRPEGFPATLAVGSGSDSVELVASRDTGFYAPAPLHVDSGLLLYGDSAHSGATGLSVRFHGDDIHLLGHIDDLPEWVSVRTFERRAPHIVLIPSDRAPELSSALALGAEAGWRPPKTSVLLPDGWTYSANIVPGDASAAAWDGTLLGPFGTMSRKDARLVGGLPLRGGHVYLSGGEPDLRAPSGLILLDDEPLEVPEDGVLRLAGRGLLPGRHWIELDRQRIRFGISTGSGALNRQPNQPCAMTLANGLSIRGAAAPPGAGRHRGVAPILLKRSTWILGSRPGEVMKPDPLTLPTVMSAGSRSGRLHSPHAEVEIPFDPVWSVSYSDFGAPTILRLGNLAPLPLTGPMTDAARTWANVFRTAVIGAAPELWARYQAVAESIENDP